MKKLPSKGNIHISIDGVTFKGDIVGILSVNKSLTLKKKGLIKFLVPINIHSFVFSPYKIKSHFLVPVTFSLSILRTKNVDGIFLQGLKY